MRAEELEQKLKRAAEALVPDALERIQADCAQIEKGELIVMEQKDFTADKRSNLIKGMSLATAACMVLGGFAYWNHYRAVNYIVEMDVNPSLELRVNNAERVIRVDALNDDAQALLDGMDLKGVDVDIATNALIGSMVKNGYLTDASNSILISVDGKDSAKNQQVQDKLANEVNAVLSGSGVSGAVLSQTVAHNDQTKQLADKYGITQGKAALVADILNQRPMLSEAEVAALSINDLNLLAENQNVDLGNISSNGTASDKSYIGEERAKQAALTHAGVKQADVTYITAWLDFDHGRMEYEVKFLANGVEYDYDIDANTGTVLSYDMETYYNPQHPGSGNNSGTYISADKAKEIAAKDAGQTVGGVTFIKAKLELDDGRMIYDVEFYTGSQGYDYTIDAVSGAVLEKDFEIENFTIPSANNYIGEAKAKQIALEHAGVKESDATFRYVKLDVDDGAVRYDVEFWANNMEYEYDINAVTGQILSFDYDSHGMRPQQPANPGSFVGVEKAKEAALQHAGVSSANATFIKSYMDYDDGMAVYEIEFYTGNTKYDYDVDAATGKVISFEQEAFGAGNIPAGNVGNNGSNSGSGNSGTSSSNNNSGNNGSFIGEAKAQEAAMNHAGVSSSGTQFSRTELDFDDGRVTYEIEFWSGNTEYDYEVDAYTGNILKFSSEYHPGSAGSGSNIGQEKAKQIALQHAGLNASSVGYIEVDMDHDDGFTVYEIQFRQGMMEYEYEIDASSGRILSFDKEYDD